MVVDRALLAFIQDVAFHAAQEMMGVIGGVFSNELISVTSAWGFH